MNKTSLPARLDCFKAYDVRGQIGINLDAHIARDIAVAFAQVMSPKTVVLGHDCRPSSPALHQALADGLLSLGIDVIDIGLAGTEEVYFATNHYGAEGGIEVTASHNPADYNGMKMVGPGSRPLSQKEFDEVADLAALQPVPIARSNPQKLGQMRRLNPRPAYAAHVTGLINTSYLMPMKIVINAGNGVAGPAFDAIIDALGHKAQNLEIIRINHNPDPGFPKGIPNPLIPENRTETSKAVLQEKADIGIAWDGDFDRCFFFDDTGAFVEGEYLVGLLAAAFLMDSPGDTIVHDPRVIWNTRDQILRHGGTPAQSKTGHAFVKQVMRDTCAIYGGEMSAHHYFRDFMSCDSGMIPWLKLLEYLGRSDQSLSSHVSKMKTAFPSSGERNFMVDDPQACIARILKTYETSASDIDWSDGLSMTFKDWRLNLRRSSTEPLLRLNVETKTNGSSIDKFVSQITNHLI
jgi:phosphomannomutase